MSRLANVGGALLLGGASSRMGQDKAQRVVGEEAAAVRLARMLGSLFEEVWLVGGEAPPEAAGTRVPDVAGPRCALRGVVSALEAATTDEVVVLATDQIAATPALLLALTALPPADAALPRTDGFWQPLCARYRRETVLPEARARLERETLAMRGLIEALDVVALEGPDLAALDPEGLALATANTPGEWDALVARIGEAGG